MLDVLEPLYEEAPDAGVSGGSKVGQRRSLARVFHRVLLDRLTHHVHVLEMNGESYRLKHSREGASSQAPDDPNNA